MKKPDFPDNEDERLHKLDSLGIIYSPAEEVFDRITTLAQRVFGVPISIISLVTREKQWFKSCQGITTSQTPREISFCGHAILQDDTFVVSDTHLDPEFADNPLVTGDPFIRFYAGQPLKYRGANMGTICIIDREPRTMSDTDIEILRSLARWVENEFIVSTLSITTTKLIAERDEARREAIVDPLTKVWNRKGIDELLAQEIAKAKRKQEQVFAMLIDIDFFKKINDTYGHLSGDVALKEVAQHIRFSVRPYDIIGRYGGDEFLIFAKDCSDETGIRLAGRILDKISSKQIVCYDKCFRVTITIGATSAIATEGMSIQELLTTTDQALYEAKANGRNCVKFLKVGS